MFSALSEDGMTCVKTDPLRRKNTNVNENGPQNPVGISSGPFKIHEHEGRLFVTGFGLRIEVKSEEEGRLVIAELEEQGYRICY